MDDPLTELASVVRRDDREGVIAWASTHAGAPGFAGLAATVSALVERHQREAVERGATGLLAPEERALLVNMTRLRELTRGRGSLIEDREVDCWSYGVLVTDPQSVIALSVAWSRPLVVAMEATTSPRAHLAVARELCVTTADHSKLGRDFSLRPGTICAVQGLPAGLAAPLLASRWRVQTGGALRGWLDAEDIVHVTPAGGRLAYTALVEKLESEVRGARRAAGQLTEFVALGQLTPVERDRQLERTIDGVRSALDQLVALSWTPALEPLCTAAAPVLIDALRTHDDATAVVRAMGW